MNEKKVCEIVEAKLRNYNTAAQSAFVGMADIWEVGSRIYYNTGSLDRPALTSPICRRKKHISPYDRPPIGYRDDVMYISLEDLLQKLIEHCGLEFIVERAKPTSLTIKRKGTAI